MSAKKPLLNDAGKIRPFRTGEFLPVASGGTGAVDAAAARTALGLVIDTDVTSKSYVDNLVQGLSWKQAVRAASTANVTLASGVENGDTLDGVTLATGNRILLKNQSSAAENGIYVVAASGAPSRAADADSGAELVSAAVYVSEGTTNADTQWTCTTNATITVGSTSLAFAQLTSGSGGITALTGDVTASGPGSAATTIANDAVTYAKMQNVSATDKVLGRSTAGAGDVEEIACTATGRSIIAAADAAAAGLLIRPVESLIIACSDETTAITAAAGKVTFRMPYAFTLTDVRASAVTAPTGSTIVIDINESGTTILSTKLSIDATEKTSTTAATPVVISDASLADDAEITIDFDQVGSTIAGAGVKVALIGHRT